MIKEAVIALQISCLSEALYYEARGEGYQGMKAVAAVIHNRVLDDRWEDTYCGVIEEPSQFSYLRGRPAGSLPMHESQPSKVAEEIAADIVVNAEEPLMGNALYFHATHVKPRWNYNLLATVTQMGRHIFYSDK